MSWDAWLERLKGPEVLDCAIVGHEAGKESVWASLPGGELGDITAAEIKMLVGTDRSPLFAGGLTLAGRKCTTLRDALSVDAQNTLDVKTKTYEGQPDTFNISIAKTLKALLICKGTKETHGGILNKKVFELGIQLRQSGY